VGVPRRDQCLETPTPDPSPQGGGEKTHIPNYRNKFDSLRKSPAYCAYPVPKEGTSAVVTDVGTGCGGRGSVVTRDLRVGERR
jgi:hypothetical protein